MVEVILYSVLVFAFYLFIACNSFLKFCVIITYYIHEFHFCRGLSSTLSSHGKCVAVHSNIFIVLVLWNQLHWQYVHVFFNTFPDRCRKYFIFCISYCILFFYYKYFIFYKSVLLLHIVILYTRVPFLKGLSCILSSHGWMSR